MGLFTIVNIYDVFATFTSRKYHSKANLVDELILDGTLTRFVSFVTNPRKSMGYTYIYIQLSRPV